ncbi:MAG: alpha-glucosidase [Chloroflexi bacterium HGW-Chloroflexi-6]|nr:MAG: alpha-glucosidase [Chloroflexi bacterium HGW-Chloroflexi-6]
MKRILALFVALILLGVGIGSILRPEKQQLRGSLSVVEAGAPTGISQVGNYQIEWNNESGGQLTLRNPAGKILWQTVAGQAFVSAAQGKETVSEQRGMFSFDENWQIVCTEQRVEMIIDNEAEQAMTLSGHLFCNNSQSVLYNLYFEPGETPGTLQISAWLQDPQNYQPSSKFNRIFLTYASNSEEHFFGFGEQFTYFDMKGKKVPIWVSEQGVGRGEEPITTGANLTNGGAGGNAFTSYMPIPFYMTNQMHALMLQNDGYSQFDLRRPDRVQVMVYGGTLIATLFDGESPAEIIRQYSELSGRMKALPDWVHSGAIVGMQGGTEKVRQVWAELEKRGTPVSAFWLQDWAGQRTTSFGKQLWWNWEVDYDRYPGWDDMVADLGESDIRVMVYINPYVVDVSEKPNARRNLYQEALENGYLVKNPQGEPYLVLNTSFKYGMVDLTNPQAVFWLVDIIEENVLGAGASGWMADFGESLPYDAIVASTKAASAPILHNRWPVGWASVNRAIVENHPDQELVFFSRAGYSNSTRYATLFWAGDQMVSWSAQDGIKSAVTGLNTGGLSGLAYNHSDIGGYTTVTNPLKNYHRSKELLLRWMELNAFTTIFRTHEGNQPENNAQFYSDDETLDAFARWSKIFAALFDYRKTLVAEAAESGLPVVRHPFLHYPDDPETWKITSQQFMLGSDFMIAPVTDEGATEVTLYLPAGEWVHIWSGESYQGGQFVTVPAPLGQPGVFYVKGSPWGQDFVQKLEAEKLLP